MSATALTSWPTLTQLLHDNSYIPALPPEMVILLLTSANPRLHFPRRGRERLRTDEVGKRKKGHLARETARHQYWFGGVKERRGHSESSKNYQSHIKNKKYVLTHTARENVHEALQNMAKEGRQLVSVVLVNQAS